jgi:dipeptidyl aminopeptidase/acylaminoacyl peptidase
MRQDFRGGRIRVLRDVLANDAYTRSEVSYPSGETTVSGVLLRPRGPGPFPAVVLNHGYIEPSIYVTGQGLMREQDYLARAGFVVLHTDYRGHAASDPASTQSRETRLGYTRDTINAVESVKRLRYVDPDKVAMLGRSMGGGVTYNALVVKPGLVRAAVVFAPVSSDFVDNFNRWTVRERPEAAAAAYRRYGTPTQDPAFYRGLSARRHFDRITEPVLIHHGTNDESCPVRWSRTSQRLLTRAGVNSRLEIYRGEQHAFGPQWPLSMERTVGFLRRHLRG